MKEDKPSARELRRDPGDLKNDGSNRDPISGAPGAHPLGVGVGATAGGIAAGAAIGTMAGPVGTAVGAAVGAIIGGLAGKEVAELADPTLEDEYWLANYEERPYVRTGATYDDYGPAFRYGVDAFNRREGRTFDDAETDLAAGWQTARGTSSLGWDHARDASRDAWLRADARYGRSLSDDIDRDLP